MNLIFLQPVGCDKVFGSDTVVDICGVCGGVNATCDLKSGTKAGKYYWKTTWAPCSVTCGVSNFACATFNFENLLKLSYMYLK